MTRADATLDPPPFLDVFGESFGLVTRSSLLAATESIVSWNEPRCEAPRQCDDASDRRIVGQYESSRRSYVADVTSWSSQGCSIGSDPSNVCGREVFVARP